MRSYSNNGGGYQQQSRSDRFGNQYVLKTAYAVTDKQGNELPIYKCFIEVGGKLVKIEISERKKETKRGGSAMWVKATSVKKNQRQGGSL